MPASGREAHDLRAGRRDPRDALGTVAGSVHNPQTRFRPDLLGVFDHADDRLGAPLLHGPDGLFLDGGEPAGHVVARGLAAAKVHAAGEDVRFHLVDHRPDFFAQRRAYALGRENILAAHHLSRFGQKGAAAVLDDLVRDPAGRLVVRDARSGVRGAAVEAEEELRDGHFVALLAGELADHFHADAGRFGCGLDGAAAQPDVDGLDALARLGDFVGDLIGGATLLAVMVDDDDRAGVGVLAVGDEGLEGAPKVGFDLAAPKWMGDGDAVAQGTRHALTSGIGVERSA